MISIIDYGTGNLGSIQNMLLYINEQVEIISTPDQIMQAKKLVLPGVGAFNKAMSQIHSHKLVEALNDAALNRQIPILGICLGMQLMLTHSEEGDVPGLNWIPGNVKKFPADANYKVPHMGWNTIEARVTHPLLEDLPDNKRFYFVHSYYAACSSPDNILCTTEYSTTFHSGIVKNNIMGVQFHPEKSHLFGMHVLKKFAQL